MSSRIACALVLISLTACETSPEGTDGKARAGGTSAGSAGVSGTMATAGQGGGAGTSGGASGAAAGSAGVSSGGAAGNASGNGGLGGSSGVRGGAGGATSDAGAPGSEGGAAAVGGDAGAESDGAGAGGAPDGALESFELVVIGSSTAAGEGASAESRGWVSLLADELEQRVSVPLEVTNLAVSGYASAQLSSGSGSDGNIDDAVDERPNLILVALAGSNDLGAGVSADTFLSRSSDLRQTANDAGIPVFFLSTAPKDLSQSEREALRDWASAMGEAFDPCWVPSQGEYTPCFVDVFAPLANASLGILSEYGAGDGIHLNDAGHAAIFEAVEPIVSAYVCSVAACD